MWKEVLFISNLSNAQGKMCMGWGWYLQVDFQLFVLGLALLFLFKYHPRVSIVTTIFTFCGSIAFNLYYTIKYKVHIAPDLSPHAD